MNENKEEQNGTSKISPENASMHPSSETDSDFENIYSSDESALEGDKKKVIIAIFLVILVIIIVVGVFVNPLEKKEEKREEPPESSSNVEEKEELFTLEDIASKIDMEALEKLGFEVSLEGDNLVISTLVEEVPYNFVFRIVKDTLTLELEEETDMAYQVWAYVLDALGQLNGNEAGEVLDYLSRVENPKEVSRIEEEDQILWSVSLKTKFDTNSL